MSTTQTINVADKVTLDSVNSKVTNIVATPAIKYDATAGETKVYDPVNEEYVTLQTGGGGGASPTLVVVNDSGTMTGKDVTVESQDGLFTQTKTMTSANYETYELPWLGTYYIKWELNGVMHSQTAVVDSVGGVVSTACIPRLTIINGNRDFDGKTIKITSVNDSSETYTLTMPSAASMEVELKNLGNYEVTYPKYNGVIAGSEIVVVSSVSGTSITLQLVESYPNFTDASDAAIAAMLDLHYQDQIDLSTIWSVGDTRKLSLSSMQAPNPNSSNIWTAQDIIITILDFNHTDLATPINGHTKAALTLQTREVLNNNTLNSNQPGHIYVNGDSAYDKSFTKWSNLYMRTYLNDKVYNAFPSEIKSAIKPSKHYRHTNYNTSSSEVVTDNLFLPSCPEIFGTVSSNYVVTSPVEGTQFKYYETAANRIKYGNNNGASNGVVQYWWEGSASSYYDSSYGYCWGLVDTSGSAGYLYGNYARGLAPAFAM